MPKGVYKRTKPIWNKGLTKENDDRVAQYSAKRKDTLIERYGSTSYNNINKIKQTNLKRYGVENAFQTQDYNERNEKSKHTCLEKYGYEHASQNPNVIEKMKNTFRERYGVNSIAQLPGVGEKISKSLSSEEVQQKMKNTCLEKYGVEYIMQRDETKRKLKETKFVRYGDENYNYYYNGQI